MPSPPSILGQTLCVVDRRWCGRSASTPASADHSGNDAETDAYDQTHKAPIRKGLGYLLGDNGIAMGGRSNSFGHSGFGGSYGFADPDYGLSFALTKNRLVATTPPEVPASVVLANTVREALSVPNG